MLSSLISSANRLIAAVASGLYYLSELVEEHTVLTKKLLTRLIYCIVTVQLLLVLVDGLPLLLSSLSIGSHVVYAGNLRRFPIVKLTDPLFLLSCRMPGSLRCRRTQSLHPLKYAHSPGCPQSLSLVPPLFYSAFSSSVFRFQIF